jgi:hypothetical protein
MFHVNEVDTLAAMNNRSGSTTMTIIREAFSGETIGFSYITRGRDVHVEAHTYRMTLVVSVQPARAGALMADAGGGTPQRFLWFPAIDPRGDRSYFGRTVYPLDLPSPGEWMYPSTLTVPKIVEDTIIDEALKRSRGDTDALDGHALFCREKTAFSLAVLDGRTQMNEEDWRLSGIAAEVSRRTREWVVGELRRSSDEDAAERGRLMGVTYAESDAEKALRNAERSGRVARWVSKKLAAGPISHRDLARAVASRDRAWLRGALLALEADGKIGKDESDRWVLR